LYQTSHPSPGTPVCFSPDRQTRFKLSGGFSWTGAVPKAALCDAKRFLRWTVGEVPLQTECLSFLFFCEDPFYPFAVDVGGGSPLFLGDPLCLGGFGGVSRATTSFPFRLNEWTIYLEYPHPSFRSPSIFFPSCFSPPPVDCQTWPAPPRFLFLGPSLPSPCVVAFPPWCCAALFFQAGQT